MNNLMKGALGIAILCLSAMVPQDTKACSRIYYVGDTAVDNPDSVLRVVGRSLDWKTPIPTNIYVYPAGMAKRGDAVAHTIHWVSKYGAVYAVGYDGGVTEGMNEKGLVINGLFCKGTVYNNKDTEGRPSMTLAMFTAWLLDMNATTHEVCEVLRRHDFSIGGATFDSGTASVLHWGITDAEGNCAMVEFADGEIKIYEGKDMRMLTNDPRYPDMLAINTYWEKIGGEHMLPGTVSSPDRFVRGYFYTGHVERTNDLRKGMGVIRSLMANVSVPYLYTIESAPNVSSTQWRSYSNTRDLRYYFQNVTDNGLYYVDLKKVNLKPGAPVLKLTTSEMTDVAGDATALLRVSKPFTPMY